MSRGSKVSGKHCILIGSLWVICAERVTHQHQVIYDEDRYKLHLKRYYVAFFFQIMSQYIIHPFTLFHYGKPIKSIYILYWFSQEIAYVISINTEKLA